MPSGRSRTRASLQAAVRPSTRRSRRGQVRLERLHPHRCPPSLPTSEACPSAGRTHHAVRRLPQRNNRRPERCGPAEQRLLSPCPTTEGSGGRRSAPATVDSVVWDEEQLTPLFPHPPAPASRSRSTSPACRWNTSPPHLMFPAGWAARTAAYLAFGDTYRSEREEADRWGWPARALPGGHLHPLTEPRRTFGRDH